MEIGDKVRRQHVWDGTTNGGKPIGEVLTVIDIVDHSWHGGAMVEEKVVAKLSDGQEEFVWNLTVVESEQ